MHTHTHTLFSSHTYLFQSLSLLSIPPSRSFSILRLFASFHRQTHFYCSQLYRHFIIVSSLGEKFLTKLIFVIHCIQCNRIPYPTYSHTRKCVFDSGSSYANNKVQGGFRAGSKIMHRERKINCTRKDEPKEIVKQTPKKNSFAQWIKMWASTSTFV